MHGLTGNNRTMGLLDASFYAVIRMLVLGPWFLVLCSACSLSVKPAITGDKLVLPRQIYNVSPGDFNDTYYRFSGVYPARWPEALVLPQNSFIVCKTSSDWTAPAEGDRGAILLRPGKELETYQLTGICPGEMQKIFYWFYSQFTALNLSAKYTPTLDNSKWTSMSTQHTECNSSELASYKLIVRQYKQLSGYVAYELKIELKNATASPTAK